MGWQLPTLLFVIALCVVTPLVLIVHMYSAFGATVLAFGWCAFVLTIFLHEQKKR
jgi:hypothetical protein